MNKILSNQVYENEAPRIVPLKLIRDDRGILGVIEQERQVSFPFRRFYFITSCPEGAERGGHAHKTLRQCLFALRGSVVVELMDGERQYSFSIDSCDQGLMIPPGYWRVLRGLSADAVIGVVASQNYEESDYIRDFDEFLKWSQASRTVSAVSYLPLDRYLDPRYAGPLADQILEGARAALESGHYIGGAHVEAFEAEFAAFCGASDMVGVANGLEALQLALMASGVGPGDEVIVPAHTFVATALAVLHVGATPVLADVEADTGLLDVTRLDEVIGPKTRAVVPVHLYGHPVDMDPLMDIAGRHGLFVLEDAAQAHGASYRGRRAGVLGDAAAFSFYPTKNLGAMGDAGAVMTRDPAFARKVRGLANYGATTRYHHEVVGMNSRLDPVQAAVLSRKLPWVDAWNERRRQIAQIYLDAFAGLDGVATLAVRPWATPVWHVFALRIGNGRRDALAAHLAERGVGTNIHYPVPVHRQACFAGRTWSAGAFPGATRLADEVLSLPLHPFLSYAEINYVIDSVISFFCRH